MARKKTSQPHLRSDNTRHEKGRLLEHLVRLLETGLADRDCTIICRHHLIDKTTGQPREVDIYISAQLGGRLHETVIECRHHRAKVDVSYVDQVVSKRADIGSPKVCIVSRSGFTKPALAKAERHGIITSTVTETEDPRWCNWLVGASFVELTPNFEVQRWAPIYASAGEFTITDELRNSTFETLVFHDKEGSSHHSFRSLANANQHRWREPLTQKLETDGPFECTLNLILEDAYVYFLHFKEAAVRIAGISIGLKVSWRRHPFQLSFSEYRDTHNTSALAEIGHGHLGDGTLVALTDQAAGKKLLTIVPKDEKQPFKGSLTIVGDDTEGKPLAVRIDLQNIDPRTNQPAVVGVWRGDDVDSVFKKQIDGKD
jgi:hypothetical protein